MAIPARPSLALATTLVLVAGPWAEAAGRRSGGAPVPLAQRSGAEPRVDPDRRLSRQAWQKARQGEAYQARLARVRGRLRARLGARRTGPPPPLAAPLAPAPEPPRAVPGPAPGQGRPPAGRQNRPVPMTFLDLVRFLLLALTCSHLLPETGAALVPPPPGPGLEPGVPGPWPVLDGSPADGSATVLAAPPELQPARGSAGAFQRALVQALGPGWVPAARPAPAGPAVPGGATPGASAPADRPCGQLPALVLDYLAAAAREPGTAGQGGLATLEARLERLQVLAAEVRSRVGPATGEPPAGPMADGLASLEAMAVGLRTVTLGHRSGLLSAADAASLFALAADTLINVVNSFRVTAQGQLLTTFASARIRLAGEVAAAAAGIRADLGRDLLTMRIPAVSTPTGAPAAVQAAERERACCAYADLLATYDNQGVLGAAGAINTAAYIVATEAAAEVAVADLATAGNATTAPVRAFLAGADAAVAAAAGLGAGVLVPPPGAVPASTSRPEPGSGLLPALLAARCGAFPCRNPVIATQTLAAGETLLGSTLNLIGFSLFATAVNLRLAVADPGGGGEPCGPSPASGWNGTVPAPGFGEGLMAGLRSRALARVPGAVLAALLEAVPADPGGDPFPGAAPGLGEPEMLEAVLPSLAGAAGSAPARAAGAPVLLGALADLQRLTAAAAGQRSLAAAGTSTAGADAPWRLLEQVAVSARYALAVAHGARGGTLAPATAALLLKDIGDTLQVLVYAFLIETSAVPLEVSSLYRAGAVPWLGRARDAALGLAPAPTGRCAGCCRMAELETQAATLDTTETATRTYLAAYIQALDGSIISEALDGLALARALGPVAPGTGTLAIQSVAAGAPGAGPEGAGAAPAGGSAGPGPVRNATRPASASGRNGTATPAGCSHCACNATFATQLLALAGETRSGAQLTLVAYTLNTVIRGLRIALAAMSG